MATIQDLGKVAYLNKGTYNSETTYEINDVVTYNGSSYVSMVNNNKGNLPTNISYWNIVALKGDKGDTGKPFVIEKTYESIEDMVDDYDNMEINDYVMVSGDIEEEENATLWTKTETEVSPYKWVYLADFSGASGITGATPNITIGTVTEGNEPSVTRRAGSSNENPILDFVLKTGATGATGATGNGISSITKTGASGLIDTYTVAYTNGNSTTFTVTNGNGISSIVKTSTSGLVDTYTITYTNGNTSTLTVTNGEDGEVTQAQLDETNNNVDWLQTLVNQMPTVSGQGTDISLQDVLNYRLMKFMPMGVSSQESTTGKNLLPNNGTSQTSRGIIFTINADKSITLNGTNDNTGNSNLFIITENDNFKLPAGTYYTIATGIAGINMAGYDDSSYITLAGGSGNTFTLSQETTFSNICVQVGKGNATTFNNTKIYPIIATTSVTTDDYEPYTGGIASPNPNYPFPVKSVTGENSLVISNSDNTLSQNYSISLGNIEICKIGDYQDYIYKNGDNWYKKGYIGKAVLDGSVDEGWMKSPSYLGSYYLPSGLSNTFTQADLLCNYFTKMPNGNVSQNYRQGLCFIENPNGTIDCWYDDGTATLEQFKTWLSTHNLIVYYQLATPTDVQITDSTLIEQLNNIYNNAYSYNGTTNITTTYASGNEQMYLDFEALMDLNSLVTRIETLEAEQ